MEYSKDLHCIELCVKYIAKQNWRVYQMNLETIKKTFDVAVKYPYIKRVGVFGSYSRGMANPASDLDVLLEYDDSSDKYMDDLGEFMEDIESQIKLKIDYMTYNGLVRKSSEPFKRQVLNDVKWLYIAEDNYNERTFTK